MPTVSEVTNFPSCDEQVTDSLIQSFPTGDDYRRGDRGVIIIAAKLKLIRRKLMEFFAAETPKCVTVFSFA